MEISLDNPGFSVVTTDAELHFSDPPRSSGSSSSTSGESTRRSCTMCHGRMSSFSLDKHLFCTKCRGSDCSMLSRCDECMQWTKEEMEKYVKLRKSLSSKSKRSKSSPPRSIPHDRDSDVNIATQLDSLHKSVDDKIETMSVNLMARFSSMLDDFQSRVIKTSCPDSSAVLGQSATNTEPVSSRPTDRTKCPAGLRFRKGSEGPVLQEVHIASDNFIDETPETLRHPPGDAREPQGRRSAPAFVRHHQAGAGFDSQPDDDDDDDRDSVADSAPSDKTYIRLMHYIHDRFPRSEPASTPREPPLCEFEEFSQHRRLHRQQSRLLSYIHEWMRSSARVRIGRLGLPKSLNPYIGFYHLSVSQLR